jgi:hypothetical protein
LLIVGIVKKDVINESKQFLKVCFRLHFRSFGESSTTDKTGSTEKTGHACDVPAFLKSNVEKIFRDQVESML